MRLKFLDKLLCIPDLERKKFFHCCHLAGHIDKISVDQKDFIHLTFDKVIDHQPANC